MDGWMVGMVIIGQWPLRAPLVLITPKHTMDKCWIGQHEKWNYSKIEEYPQPMLCINTEIQFLQRYMRTSLQAIQAWRESKCISHLLRSYVLSEQRLNRWYLTKREKYNLYFPPIRARWFSFLSSKMTLWLCVVCGFILFVGSMLVWYYMSNNFAKAFKVTCKLPNACYPKFRSTCVSAER